jgi:hypothetical protein
MYNDFDNKYIKVKIHMIFLAFIIIGALNWGLFVFNYNLVETLHLYLNKFLGVETYIDKVIYLFILISGIIIGLKKSTWLPFLGETVLPSQFITNRTREASDFTITVKVAPFTRVAYWASLPQDNKNKIPDVVTAYGDFSNSGVVTSDKDGNAELAILNSTSYKVPSGNVIKRHVHYRELDQQFAFLGEVKTVFY